MNFHKLIRSAEGAIGRTRYYSSVAKEELPASFVLEEVEYVPERDKSGLRRQHKNVLHETLPYDEAHSWIHLTEKYQRTLYGRYGSKSNVNPKICFGTLAERTKAQELQRITQPETLPELLEKIRIQKEAKLAAINEREENIQKKLDKLEQWKAELNAKVEKRRADAAAAIQRKERLIEEVRRHFGFKVDARDERFKEMLEQKEKEDKRKQKEAKRKVKEEKMMAKLIQQTS
ncbi:growth arrest and DNA damage-inducible proteins-interacting protein 1 [Drosophila navojoa]|uniref:growth arrest and DNA damage-inducible proteins-interacting protein 1 n=1 Tax=Drosophila navojoa TaxID=7232 RepID=UPI00084782DA|nr:growth arrest and DNA damage-inducible proteins-interacting protein 1 [Drosophila navojoa]